MHQFETAQPVIDAYVERLRQSLKDLPYESVENIVSHARARIELELDIDASFDGSAAAAEAVLNRLGRPAVFGQRMQAEVLQNTTAHSERSQEVREIVCPTCGSKAPLHATFCPVCSVRLAVRAERRTTGFEWRSPVRVGDLPLVHVAVGRNALGKQRVARGVIAVGQFAVGGLAVGQFAAGLLTVAQFGIGGIVGIGQFIAAPLAVSQFALALAAIALIKLELFSHLPAFGLLKPGLLVGMVLLGWVLGRKLRR